MDPAGAVKKIRVCLDLRPLNGILEMENTLLPTIDELLHHVSGYKFYSSLDLKSGYNQLSVAEEDRKYLAFNWKGTTYQFNAAPFGISFLPAKFHKLIPGIFSDIKGIVVYLDDTCVFSMTEEEHDRLLEEVVRKLKMANLNLNRKKCEFKRRGIRLWGYQVSSNGIEIDYDRRKRLLQALIPTTVRKIKPFLGAISFIYATSRISNGTST